MQNGNNQLVGVKRIEHYSYILSDQIGRGYSSSVYRGKDDRTNEPVAIKVVDMKMLQDDLHRELLRSEISCLNQLKQSQNILKIIETFSTVNNTYIVTEMCEGKDLAKLIRAKKSLTEQEILPIAKQMIAGYLEIYRKSIVHRDLKPANIFFKNGVARIADFGFAVKAAACQRPSEYNLGSPSYMSPEALRDNCYSFKSDIWSLGVILFEMMHGKVPWKSKTDAVLLRLITYQPIESLVNKEQNWSKGLIDFLNRACNPVIRARMSPEELLNWNWNQGSKLDNPADAVLSLAQRPISYNPLNGVTSTTSNNNTNSNNPNIVAVTPTNQIATTTNLFRSQIPFGNNRTSVGNGSKSEMPPPPPQQPQQQMPAGMPPPQPSVLVVPYSLYTGEQQLAEGVIVSQVQYCRYMTQILTEVQRLADNDPLKKDLGFYFRNELVQKTHILTKMVNQEENFLLIRGLKQLQNTERWAAVKDMVLKYSSRYLSRYNNEAALRQIPPESILVNAIRAISASQPLNAYLLQRLVNYYQIKLLEKKIDYNEFGDKSKIDMLVNVAPGAGFDVERLRSRIQMLGLV